MQIIFPQNLIKCSVILRTLAENSKVLSEILEIWLQVFVGRLV